MRPSPRIIIANWVREILRCSSADFGTFVVAKQLQGNVVVNGERDCDTEGTLAKDAVP